MIRHTSASPCRICGGHEAMPRGQGTRCAGFTSDDGVWVNCSRTEFAGDLRLDQRTSPPTYLHRIGGPCNCGHEHAPAQPAQNGRRHPAPTERRRIVATYDYVDASGRVLYRVARFDPKGFVPQHMTEAGAWANGFASEERILYRLPELLANPDRGVFVVEGEKDCDRLASLGLIATTNPGGAASWRKHATEYAEPFRGRRQAVVIPDNDAPGRQWATEVAASLVGAGCPVRVLELAGLPDGGDVSDWLDAGHTIEELRELVKVAPTWKPPTAAGEPATPIDTAALLDEIRAVLRRYLILPDGHFYDVVALWVLHAHAIVAADTSPRLIFKSPEKESGKTRALEVLELLVPAPLAVMNTTIAAIFRLLKEEQATVLFDEVDAIFNSKVGNYEDLRALLNAGYRRGATVARVVGEGKGMRTERYPVFAATALAAIGDLPDTIESRAIILPMRRRAPDECIEQFRRRRVAAGLEEMRSGLCQWGPEHIDELGAADPAMPDELTDRAADCWEPLLAIACR